jgi:sugar phosphate isomerase/epimerase
VVKLSYCTFGLTALSMPDAIAAVHAAGYPGIELSFHRDQFNPFTLSDGELMKLRRLFDGIALKPACVATASHFFTPSRPHEPSLMCIDLAGRKRRIDLVKRGIHVARQLGIPLVTFGSGFVRDEHIANPSVDPGALLADSIDRCLQEIDSADDITLLIEPEPGMYIETLEQAIDLVNTIDSPRFQLHLDLCHLYCSEDDVVAALTRAAPHTRYLHISDTRTGCNLKLVSATAPPVYQLDFADYLVYFPDTADFLLLDRAHPCYFHDNKPGDSLKAQIASMTREAGIESPVRYVDYHSLYAGATELDDEVFTYLISVPGLSFDVLERAHPIITFLRSNKDSAGRLLMDRRVANTLTGAVHFHEIPGEGTLDFAACFAALKESRFSGYASVELYHHVTNWDKALKDSYRHLAQFV